MSMRFLTGAGEFACAAALWWFGYHVAAALLFGLSVGAIVGRTAQQIRHARRAAR